MTTAWVAASVRARAMARRRLGAAAARGLASRPSLDEAVDALAATPYGRDVRPGHGLAEAQRAVAGTLLWHLRVLSGWAPHGDARILRVLAGGFEVANTDERIRELAGAEPEPPFHLGSLATAWSQLQPAGSVGQIREVLARSAWGDPGADTPAAVHLGLRWSWAARVAATVPPAAPWAAGAAALLAARELARGGRRPTGDAARLAAPLLGAEWAQARSVRELAAVIPPDARWALEGVTADADLWVAEAAWWARLERDGFALLRRPLTTADPVVGSVAVLAADAWRVRAALEVAARGGAGRAGALEAFDALA